MNHKHSARVHSAWGIASQSDVLVFVVDAARQVCQPDPRVLRLVTNIATLGSGAHKRKAAQALPLPSVDTTAAQEAVGQVMGAVDGLLDEGMMDAVEGALQQAISEGGVDRAQLEHALEALLDGAMAGEDAQATAALDNTALVAHDSPGDGLVVAPAQHGAARPVKVGLKSLAHLNALTEVEGGQQLTDFLQQRRDALQAARPPQTGTLAQAVCPPCILVMNKMDMLSRREKLLALRWAMRMIELHNFDDVFYISAERRKYGF